MQKKLQQLKTLFQQNKLFFLCLLLLFALPLYSGEILVNSHAYIFGKYINYLHIRLSLHLLLSLAVIFVYFQGKFKAIFAARQKSLLRILALGSLLALFPLYNILQLPVEHKALLYFSSLYHLAEFLTVAAALLITIKVILTARKEFAPFIFIAIALSLEIQGIFGLVQFLLKGPLLPQFLSWTGQPIEFTSNSIIGIFEYARVYGTTPHPNILAGILNLFAFILLTLEMPKASKIGGISLITLLLLGTMSKTGLLAFILLLIIYTFRRFIPLHSLKSKTLILTLVLANLLTITFLFFSQKLPFTFTFVESRAVIQQLYLELLTTHRLLLIFGTGFTLSIPTLLANTTPLHTSIIWGNQILAEPAHNTMLLSLIEFGIPGFLIIFLSTFSLTQKLFQDLESWKKLTLFSLVLALGLLDHYLLY